MGTNGHEWRGCIGLRMDTNGREWRGAVDSCVYVARAFQPEICPAGCRGLSVVFRHGRIAKGGDWLGGSGVARF